MASKILVIDDEPDFCRLFASVLTEMGHEVSTAVGGRQGLVQTRENPPDIVFLDVNYATVRIYQDGLPLCGREMDIVRDVAAQGSQNHRLVLALVQRGAFLEGTEDVQLLLEEYHYIQEITMEHESSEKRRKAKLLSNKRKLLLRRRDQFIAQRIDETLKEGETGILFVGMAHQVDEYLPKDIHVSFLIFRLPFSMLRQSAGH